MEHDFLRELGLLSVVTRLKRISEAMIHDGRRLYKELGMEIEPNWYVIFRLLQKHGELTVMEIADKIGFAHPSVISIVNKMIKADYLEENKCGFDHRKRLLKLTPKAFQEMPEFERVWEAGTSGMKRMLTDLDMLNILDKIEDRIFESGFKQRTLNELEKQKEVEVVEFEPKYASDFANLNYEWISEYFAIEAQDRKMLDNPNEYIISRGGQIFIALLGGEAVGTVALIKEPNESFELAKMAVTSKHRGLKIGDKLMATCLGYAKKVGKKRVFLLSNRKLIPALTLYKKFGFEEVPINPNTSYQRTDIEMELILKP
jgi:N-acetylglutamate synthase-like GNAT family acetyltransferase/DNA-binding MarR family transcriptional regulator